MPNIRQNGVKISKSSVTFIPTLKGRFRQSTLATSQACARHAQVLFISFVYKSFGMFFEKPSRPFRQINLKNTVFGVATFSKTVFYFRVRFRFSFLFHSFLCWHFSRKKDFKHNSSPWVILVIWTQQQKSFLILWKQCIIVTQIWE